MRSTEPFEKTSSMLLLLLAAAVVVVAGMSRVSGAGFLGLRPLLRLLLLPPPISLVIRIEYAEEKKP